MLGSVEHLRRFGMDMLAALQWLALTVLISADSFHEITRFIVEPLPAAIG